MRTVYHVIRVSSALACGRDGMVADSVAATKRKIKMEKDEIG